MPLSIFVLSISLHFRPCIGLVDSNLTMKKKNASLRNVMWRASFLVIDSYAMSCYHDAFSTFLLTNQHELGVFITQKLGMRRSRVNPRGNSSTYLFLKIIILLRNALVIMMAETY